MSWQATADETDHPDVKLCNTELIADAGGGSSATTESVARSVEDLINLTHLHEPAILHLLSLRFAHNLIYTYTGPILLAVNPFKSLPLYTEVRGGVSSCGWSGVHVHTRNTAFSFFVVTRKCPRALCTVLSFPVARQDQLQTYYSVGLLRSQGVEDVAPLPPHVFAIADNAYRSMMSVEDDADGGAGNAGAGAGAGTAAPNHLFPTFASPCVCAVVAKGDPACCVRAMFAL